MKTTLTKFSAALALGALLAGIGANAQAASSGDVAAGVLVGVAAGALLASNDAPARPVYYAPGDREGWRHEHWRHERWEHERREHAHWAHERWEHHPR